ncbi:SDR family oxidoreductase [Sphingobium sufflavum]|nr:SDR family oxidoreductase [Sphingobium sufflavum]
MAEMFVAEGARVICADISGHEAAVAKALGANAVATHADVTSTEDVGRMVALAEDRFGRLDILCNNAGTTGPFDVPLHEMDDATFDMLIDVNLRGVFNGMRCGIVSMLRTGGGSIVNTASASGLVGWKGLACYSASKAAVVQLTKSAALDYADQNIRINAVCPGMTWTGLVPWSEGRRVPTDEERSLPHIPLKRWGLDREIAAAALFLASDEASFVTGAALPVDGGYVSG